MKLFKKSLSVLMAVVIALGTLSAAVWALNASDLTPAVKTKLDNYKAAIDAAGASGALSLVTYVRSPGSDATATAPATTTITDTSPGGDVFEAARIFEDLLKDDGYVNAGPTVGAQVSSSPGALFPHSWWAEMFFDAENYLKLSGAKLSLASALVNMRQNSGARADNGYSKDGTWCGSIGSNPAHSSVTTTRTELAALSRDIADWDALMALPAGGVVTSMTYGMDAGIASRSNPSSQNQTGPFNYFTGRQTTTYGHSNTEVNNLKDYYNYFFGGTLLEDVDPFTLTPLEVTARVAANAAAVAKLTNFTAADIAKFFPQNEEAVEFIKACNEADTISDYEPNISYFQDAPTALLGSNFIALIQGQVATPGSFYDATNLTDMEAIWFVMNPEYERLLNTSAAGKAKLTELYAMDFPAITAARAVLQRDIQLVELANKKVEIDAYHADNYMDRDALKALDDTDLADLKAMYAGFVDFLAQYPQERIAEVFTSGTEHIEAYYGAICYESDLRGLESDLENIYQFVGQYLGKDLTAIKTKDLLDALSSANTFSDDFFAKYDAEKDTLTPEDQAKIFGNYPEDIPRLIDQINRALEGRFTVQVATAMDLYTDVGEVSWENVSVLRRMIGFVESSIFDRLEYTDYISAKTRADYAKLFDEILEEFNEFTRDGGYHSFEKYDTQYPVRNPYPDDIVAGHQYKTSNAKLGSIIDPLEQFLVGDELKTLLADLVGIDFDLKTMITGALDGLWSDALINTIVSFLYPTILEMLEQEWGNLPEFVIEPSPDTPYDDQTTNVRVTKRTLREALTDASAENTARTRLRLLPEMLAAGIQGQGFDSAYDALRLAEPEVSWSVYPYNVWKHSSIADADGKLTLKWGVDDPNDVTTPGYENYSKEERFIKGLSAATSGMWDVMAALLCGKRFTARVYNVGSIRGWTNVSDLVQEKTGSTWNDNIKAERLFLDLSVDTPVDGYAELLTPIFEALLGDDTSVIPTVAELRGYTSSEDLMGAIFRPVLYFAKEKLPGTPLNTLLGMLPNVAYALSMDNAIELFKTLVLNLTYLADGKLDGYIDVPVCGKGWQESCVGYMSNQGMAIGDSLPVDIYGLIAGDSLGGLDLGALLSDFNAILDMVTEGLLPGVKLPIFNTGKVATMGTLLGPIPSKRPSGERYRIEADKADVLLYLLQYLLSVVEDPACVDGIFAMLADIIDEDTGEPAIGDLRENKTVMDLINNIASHPDDVIAALIELFVPQEYAMEKYGWLYTNQANATMTHYTSIWKKPDANYVINNLDDFLNGIMKLWGVYDSNGDLFSINGLLKGVIDGLYTNANLTKIALLVKDTIAGLKLDDKIASLVNDLVGVNINAWNKYSEGHNWGFTDGDRNGFFSGIVELLRPALPLLRFLLLQEGDLAIFDLVKANGYEGYAQGIIPLLEALGAKNIKTPNEYRTAAAANPDNMITAILVPLMGVLDEVSSDPVNALLEKLPAIFYFLQSGGLNTAVNNTIQALNVVLDTVRPIMPINLFDLNIDYYSLIDMLFGLVNDAAKTNFSVPRDALSTFLVGNVTKFTSMNGDTAYTLVPEAEDSLTALLRFMVNFVYYRDNRDAIIDLLTGLVGMKSDFIKQADALFDGLRKLYLKNNGADVVLNTLLNTLKVTNAFTKTTQNLLDGFNKNWVAILAVMKNSGGFLAEFANSLEGFLDKNFKDILDSNGRASSGLLKFFSAVGAWIKTIWNWIVRYIFFGWLWMK